MRRKKKKSENSERWLLTYSDLITLLMILFIVLFAFGSIDQNKFDELSKSLNEALGGNIADGGESVLDGEKGVLDQSNSVVEDPVAETQNVAESNASEENTVTEEENFKQAESEIVEIINNSEYKDSIDVSIGDRGLIISFADNLLFESGKADINQNMMDDFDKIAKIISQFNNPVYVEGHTDNIPIHNSEFASNWQLSSIRAANVVQYLVEYDGIQPERLSAVGYGEYNPIASNNTPEGRASNRRVDLVILYSENISN